jgi:hypothetical protein
MLYVGRSIKIVILDCPYAHWLDPKVRDIFHQTVQLKLDGYFKEYASGCLPIDASDFFTIHVLVCEERPDATLEVLQGFKMTPWHRSMQFNLDFPALSMASASRAPGHVQAVRKILGRCARERKVLTYVHGWTIRPEIRKDRELTAVLRDLTVATHTRVFQHYGVDESIICGSVKFKTDRFLQRLGYQPLKLKGHDLPTFHQQTLANEEVLMLHMDKVSEEAEHVSQQFELLWRRRITIGGEPVAAPGAAKAA